MERIQRKYLVVFSPGHAKCASDPSELARFYAEVQINFWRVPHLCVNVSDRAYSAGYLTLPDIRYPVCLIRYPTGYQAGIPVFLVISTVYVLVLQSYWWLVD